MVTRITNSMLSRTLLSNLSLNLNNVDRLQNQLSSGRKYAHISDDPAALIFGQAARNKLNRLSHYQESVSTAQNWLTQAEMGVMELQKMTGHIYEELINAGGPKTISDRQNIGMMVGQMKSHYLDTLNASYGDRFVFSGYNTPGDYVEGKPVNIKPFTFDDDGYTLLFNGFNVSQFDGMPAVFLHSTNEAEWDAGLADMTNSEGTPLYPDGLDGGPDSFIANFTNPDGTQRFDNADEFKTELLRMHQMMNDLIHFDVAPGVSMPVTMNGLDLIFFSTQDPDGNAITRNMYEFLDEIHTGITGVNQKTGEPLDEPMSVHDGDEIQGLTMFIKTLQDGQNHLLVKTAEIGGRTRRLELLDARYEQDNINYESMRSDAEDADIAEVIMYLRMAETVYQAALNAGSRVIQPTLMDFLR